MAQKTARRGAATAKPHEEEIEVNLEESPHSLKAKAARLEKSDPDEAPKRTARVRCTATRLGYYDNMRVREGVTIAYEAELDEENRPILPTWLVLEKDYVPAEEPQLPPGMQKVRGGATQGGLKL